MWEKNKIQMKQIFIQFLNELDFKIVYQTEIENDFGPNERDNRFFLISNGYPEVYDDGLYVLGNDIGWENTILRIKSQNWKNKLLKAIKEYNKENI